MDFFHGRVSSLLTVSPRPVYLFEKRIQVGVTQLLTEDGDENVN